MLIVALIAAQLLIFGALVFIFRRIMTQNVTQATQHLEEMGQDFAEKEASLNKQLEESQSKAQEIIKSAEEDVRKMREDILKRTGEEKDSVINQARTQAQEIVQQADRSRQQLLGELEERIAKEAVLKACELIQSSLPDNFKQEVHGHWVDDLLNNGFAQLSRLRIPDAETSVKVISPFPLTGEQRRRISEKLKGALGREFQIQESLDPSIVAGVVISIGSLVLDGGLRNKIQEKAR